MTTTTALSTLAISPKAKLPEILTTALAVPTATAVPEVLYDIPKPIELSPEASIALTTVATMEPVTVTERRKLTHEEIVALSDERSDLDALEKYIKARKDAQRAMIFNHLDVEAEEAGEDAPIDSKGHFIKAGSVDTGTGKRFTRELRTKAPVLTAEGLRDVVDQFDDEVFSYEDYLAVTTQVRVLDEEKALIAMRTKPGIIQAFAKAAEPGETTASMYRR